jgi:predicted nucleotidyltransferase component of viral defense system
MDEREYEEHHKAVMRAVIASISDSDLLLKGGTALMFGYGIDRFSDDIDFDANRPIRDIEKKISRAQISNDIKIVRVDTLKDTNTVGRYRVQYASPSGIHSLKVEISYRNGFVAQDAVLVEGFQVAAVSRIIDQKLLAAFDGERPRTKARDLYDLEFLSKNFPKEFTPELARRFKEFTDDPERLFSLYRPAFKEDDLIFRTDDEIEEIVLRLHDNAQAIYRRVNER